MKPFLGVSVYLLQWRNIFLVLLLSSQVLAQEGRSQVLYEGSQILVEGELLHIVCHTSMFEPIAWLKDGKSLVNGSSYVWHTMNVNNSVTSQLQAPHARTHYTGSYQCTPVSQESLHVYVMSARSIRAGYDFGKYKVIKPKTDLKLNCSTSEPVAAFFWKKNGVELKGSDEISLSNSDTKNVTYLVIRRPSDSDAGSYECVARLNNTDATLHELIEVVSEPTAKMEADLIVVEKERLVLSCQVTGVPDPNVTWTRDGMPINSSAEHIKFRANDKNVSNAILQIDEVMMADRGQYNCHVTNLAGEADGRDGTKVRVKDRLAALWPFIGICVEVLVLCAIIFIYEKKRNKAELDESDTDNSPEQKNTPDHGKDSVRQRK